jgi:hypothetical protein
LGLEDVDFRRKGTHIEMLTRVLNNLKAQSNHNVRIGVFDTSAYSYNPVGWPFGRSNLPLIRSHGYHEVFGVGYLALKNADPYGTAFAIAKAAARSDYELIRVADELIKIHNIWPYSPTDALTPIRNIYIYIFLSHSSNDMVKKHHCPKKGKDGWNCRRVGSFCKTQSVLTT